ncbi:MAG TPA: FAD-dependent oxidoreductase [Gaiellaceae bacterium]|nr:FAD-dependent oxidoreductase [Gaiellaceae bacterium]
MRRLNNPFWLAEAHSAYPALTEPIEVDVAVVGAGITGTTAAYLLKREGLSVALLESDRLCAGATGYTTAKLTVGHSLVYRELIDSFGVETARAYARSNQEAIERVAAIVDEHVLDCDFERAGNYVYTEARGSAGKIEREAEAARAAGIDAELTTETDLPYPVAAAIHVPGQAQFHPWKYVAGLAGVVAGDGSHVLERTRATGVRAGDPCTVQTTGGPVRARHVVIATQLPFADRGLFFAKAHPVKSYAIAALIEEGHAPRGMYISVDQPTRSVRSTPGEGGRVLIVGGESHRPGEDRDTTARYRRLEEFMHERFGVEAPAWHWSTHDYAPLDRLPYIGRLRRNDGRVLVATGFSKWGMTKGTLAASILTDAILGRPNEYAALYDAHRVHLRQSAPSFAKENGRVGVAFFRDRLRPRDGRRAIEALKPGEGTIARIGRKQIAAYREDGATLHLLSARCTHLGCILGWNAADKAWECPCHGSRFAGDGTLVQGPATVDLPRETLPRVYQSPTLPSA